MGRRILVAGIGNVFFGDDGFGVAVVRRLADAPALPGVRVMDIGIRGIDLTYALLEGWELAILVDATPRGRPPGTLYVLDVEPAPVELAGLDAHGLHPQRVLSAARAAGAELGRVRVVGCEPKRLGTSDEPTMELSAEVAAAVGPAAELVRELCEVPHA